MLSSTSTKPEDRPEAEEQLAYGAGGPLPAGKGRLKALFGAASEHGESHAALSATGSAEAGWQRPARYAAAVAAVAVVAIVATPLLGHLERANIVMLFLLVVLLAALWLGRGPAVAAAFLSVAAFDLFFVPPHFTFAVADAQYLITFAVMLTVALITGQLTAGLRLQLAVAESRQRRTRALYELARELSAALTVEQIAEVCERVVAHAFNARCRLLLPDSDDRLQVLGGGGADADPAPDLGIAQWSYDRGEVAGLSVGPEPSAVPMLYLPLTAPMRTRGVLAVAPAEPPWSLPPEQQRLMETSATLIAIAVERVHYIAVAQDALLRMESERLRNSLLAALSHDLRTPLTSLVGLADSLVMTAPSLPPAQTDLALAIREEALRTSGLVHNLLDMARLQAGEVQLRREWQPLEEVVGAALQARASVLGRHTVIVELPADLPLVEFDAVLIERVFCNLLENAAKYTPPGSRIRIGAHHHGGHVEVFVADDGPGLPPGREETLFDKFQRGREESAISGVGLGLAIARAVVESHGGRIRAENRPEGGARFAFTLPAGEPPTVPEEAP